jgi:hypothetical protein
MSQHVLREEIDYTIFAAEPEFYLAELHGGCLGGEREALQRTMRNWPGLVTEDDVRAWARDPKFRAALKYARACGEENRRYDQRRAQGQGDPFATPPRPGTPLIPAEEFSPENPPAGGFRGWWQRLQARVQVEIAQAAAASPTTPGVRFIAESEMTDADWQAISTQSAVEAARLRREQQAQPQGWIEQPWDGKGLSPDGARWGR